MDKSEQKGAGHPRMSRSFLLRLIWSDLLGRVTKVLVCLFLVGYSDTISDCDIFYKEPDMPIKSYLAYPVFRGKTALQRALAAMPECEVMPATNQDLLVLITDTADEEAEKRLAQQLHAIDSLQCLALVSGYSDPKPVSA